MTLTQRISLLLIAAVIITAAATAGVLLNRYNEQLVQTKLVDLQRETGLQSTNFLSRLNELVLDAYLLAGTPPTRGLVRARVAGGQDPLDESTEQQWQQRLEIIFKELLLAKDYYLQARFIGIADGGLEIIRVQRNADGAVEIVGADALQRKAGEPYFAGALNAAPGTAYLSEINLNREYGEIQQPQIPVLRAAVPVPTADGQPYGMLVINLDMRPSLATLTRGLATENRYYITNALGQYIWHPDPLRAFEFEFGEVANVADEYPQLAAVLERQRSSIAVVDEQQQRLIGARQVRYGTPAQPQYLNLVVTAALQDVTAPTRSVLRNVLLILVGLMVFAVLLGLLIARRISRPIAELEAAVAATSGEGSGFVVPRNLSSETRVLAQTMERTFTALERRTTELESNNRELAQFSYIASHDLQEPLRTVTSLAAVLNSKCRDQLDETGQRSLDFMTQSCERMAALIHGLLEYSRLGLERRAERVDFNELIYAVQQDLGASNARSGATVLVGRRLPSLVVYRVEIRLLFQNLISNAMKFAKPELPPDIRISAERVGDLWEFCVEDNGQGIADEHRERVFVIFQRLHGRDEYGGTGIGLAHCRKIVEMHGGKIWVEGSPLGGAAFKFRIREVVE